MCHTNKKKSLLLCSCDPGIYRIEKRLEKLNEKDKKSMQFTVIEDKMVDARTHKNIIQDCGTLNSDQHARVNVKKTHKQTHAHEFAFLPTQKSKETSKCKRKSKKKYLISIPKSQKSEKKNSQTYKNTHKNQHVRAACG